MKTLKLFLVFGLIMALFMTPLKAQWTQAYSTNTLFTSLYFVDSLNGWFTRWGENKIMHTSDGGYTFEVQLSVVLPFSMNDVYMEDTQNGWACGGNTGSGGHIYRTTNGGVNWVQVSHPAYQSGWIQIEQVGSSIWFIGSYSGTPQTLLIMKTSDNGSTWHLTNYPQFDASRLYIFDELNFIVSADEGVLARTTDGGNSWISANLPSNYQVVEVKFLNSTLGYALISDLYSSPYDDAYLYRSTDGGFTWHLHYSWIDQGYKRSLSVIPGTGTIFVGGWLSETSYLFGMLKSIDNGNTWDTVSLGDFIPTNIVTPNSRHGWATVGPYIYRYDYVTPATVEPIPNTLIQLGQQFNYQVQAAGLGLKYTMSGNPQGLNLGLYSGLISGAPSEGGNFPITVTVKDTDINVVNAQFNLRVNRQPLFIPPYPTTQAWVDSLYQFTLRTEDLDDDTVSFTWLTKPSWLTFLTEGISSVVISGVPGINDTGYHPVSVLADDGYGGQDTLSWVINVQALSYLPVSFQAGWNLVSVPLWTQSNILQSVYPYQGTAYKFNGLSYEPTRSFIQGAGYWANFPTDTTHVVVGQSMPSVIIAVDNGWNLIGSVDHPCLVPIGEIIVSQFWGYYGSYMPESTLVPGKGYWVKTNAAGQLTLGIGGAYLPHIETASAVLQITDTALLQQQLKLFRQPVDWEWYAMPPLPPEGGFDVRFASQRMAEQLPVLASDSTYQVLVRAQNFPLKFLWQPDSTINNAFLVVDGTSYQLIPGEYLEINSPFTQVQLVVNLVTSVEPLPGRPTEFSLSQNYPNPFNPVTIIRYGLPQASEVELKVYNLLGQEVAILINEYQPIGIYQASFEASGLPSGIYLYQLRAGTYHETKKMTLLK